ncbi:MAG: glycoside hydrolase family 130 protein [Opitutaceae bacterium]|jgi:predicted GH43/DUF377 family glycosyl hydrolase|nr:glycoside hydrolase family 130 protein [Opitutaceae bacterium]
MPDIARRNPLNPLLSPGQVAPSAPGLAVECLLNPGVFRHNGSLFLLVRVAERPSPQPGRVKIPLMENGRLRVLDLDARDPRLDTTDPREFKYDGDGLLSTLSHLRLFRQAADGSFADTGRRITGDTPDETFGIEDCRVTPLPGGLFALTHTAVSPRGYGVALRLTRDWETFANHGLILPPPNKDAALLPEKINNLHHLLHRPSCVIVGGHDIWHATSPDLLHWGGHTCVARARKNSWDCARVGAGAPPVRTEHGWLLIYHGADRANRYCLGALLLDLKNPARVIARSADPIMEPLAGYEQRGFLGHVVFSNGHDLAPDNDTLTLYYGASDTVVCSATFSIREILSRL